MEGQERVEVLGATTTKLLRLGFQAQQIGYRYLREAVWVVCSDPEMITSVAKYFGHEHMIPEIEGITPFAFHKWEGTNAQYPNFYKEPFMKKCKKLVRRIIRK